MYICSNGIKTAVILQDTDAPHPRRDQDNLASMVCWHRKYDLGDPHNFDDAQEFAERLCSENLNIRDVFKGIQDGCVDGYQLLPVDNIMHKFKDYGPSYILQEYGGLPGDERWRATDWMVTKDFDLITSGDQELEDLFMSFTTRDLLNLLDHSDKVAIKTLYLYDHSVQSISTGSFVGRAHQAEWDSGPVGFVYMDKDTAMKNMAMANDKVNLTMPLEGDRKVRIFSDSHDFDGVMKQNGYAPVYASDLVESMTLEKESGQECLELAKQGKLFKKDHKLWVLDQKDFEGDRLISYDIKAIYTFNPGLTRLTEEAWKDRAFEAIEGEVKEYDNYLQGEVYGYQCYEGLEEVDSCWGFNPGSEDIQELMEDELRGWFGSKMDFEYESGENFDIEEYFEENDFPGLRELITADVKEFVVFESKTSEIYPFDIAAEDILANKDGVLEKIVQTLYEKHDEPSTDDVYDAVEEHAGISRALKPRIKAADLDPDKEYTVEEIMELMKAKAPLDQIIGACQKAAHENSTRSVGPDRDDR